MNPLFIIQQQLLKARTITNQKSQDSKLQEKLKITRKTKRKIIKNGNRLAKRYLRV
jgi:hypothetical protein